MRISSSHATRQGTPVRSRLSSLSHYGLILDVKEWNWIALADLFLKKGGGREEAQADSVEHTRKILAGVQKATTTMSHDIRGKVFPIGQKDVT